MLRLDPANNDGDNLSRLNDLGSKIQSILAAIVSFGEDIGLHVHVEKTTQPNPMFFSITQLSRYCMIGRIGRSFGCHKSAGSLVQHLA